MNKKGFTLIELLAVIVILAVIALITVPAVMNVVADAREGAANTAAKNYITALETKYEKEKLLNANFVSPSEFNTEDIATVEVKGSRPTEADLNITQGYVTGGFLVMNGYTINITADGNILNPLEEEIVGPDGYDDPNVLLGTGSEINPYQIWFIEQLDYINTDLESSYILKRNLDFSGNISYIDIDNKPNYTTGIGFTPIGLLSLENSFKGNFDGNGKTISNLYINDVSKTIGMFDSTFGANIHDLTLNNVFINGQISGALIGKSHITNVLNVNINGRILAISHAGGIGGTMTATIVKDASTNIDVESQNDCAGGIAGTGYNLTIKNANAKGTVESVSCAGGIIGESDSNTIYNVGSSVNTSGEENIGGLLGYSNDTIISKSYNKGIVTGTNYVGGLIGYSSYNDGIVNSYNKGTVTGTNNVGGVIGYAEDGTELMNVAANGDVVGVDNVGGMIGSSYFGNIMTSYVSGSLTGQTNVGGIFGYSEESSAASIFYINGANGNFGTKISIDNMKKRSTFYEWNFENSWDINGDYPYLKNITESN